MHPFVRGKPRSKQVLMDDGTPRGVHIACVVLVDSQTQIACCAHIEVAVFETSEDVNVMELVHRIDISRGSFCQRIPV